MANECDTSDSPEAQAHRAKERNDELKREQRLLDRLDDLKSVSEAHAVISDEYYNNMHEHMKNALEQDRLQDEEDGTHQAKALMGLDRIGDFASDHYHSLLCIDKNLNSINSSLKTFLNSTIKSNTKMESVNKSISERRETFSKSLHTNRNDLMMELWSAQTSQLTGIHSVLVNHATSNQKLLKGFINNMKKTLPEKSEVTQDRREQQKRDMFLQGEREKDRSILLGIHKLLEKMKFGGKAPVGRGGVGGGLAAGLIGGGLMGAVTAFLGKVWGWIKKGGLKVLGLLLAGAKFLKDGAIKFFKGIGSFLKGLGGKLKGLFVRLGGFLKNTFLMLGGKLKGAFLKLGGFLKNTFIGLASGLKGLLVRFGPILARVGLGAATALTGIGAKAVAMMGPAVAVAAAAAGGWAIGTWLDKKFGISDKIAEWLSGPNASEIAAKKIEDASFKKQSEANKSRKSLIKQSMVSTGLDENAIKSMMSGENLSQFNKLSSAQQDLIIKAQQQKLKVTQQLMKRTAKDEEKIRKDAGRFISKSEQAKIDKADKANLIVTRATLKQAKGVRGLVKLREQKLKSEKLQTEKQAIQITIHQREKQKILKQRQEAVKTASIVLSESVTKDKQAVERKMTLEERRKLQLTEVRNDNMSENLAKIAHHTEEALKSKNTYIVNTPSAPSVTTAVGHMSR